MSMVLLSLGCHSLPEVTRTGQVKDIMIGEKLSPGELSVNPGDEVRWVNKRTAPVRVVLLDSLTDKQLSCKHHFGGDTAKLYTNETASVCFRYPGNIRYTVRMKATTPAGEINVPGAIRVRGTSGQKDERSQSHQSTESDQNGQTAQVPEKSTTTTTTTTIITPSNR